MTLLQSAVLLAVIAGFAVETLAELLNLRRLHDPPPPGFETLYEPESYRRSQNYTRARTHLSLGGSTLDLALVLIAWFSGAFAWLDEDLSGLDLGPIPTGLVYLGILFLLRSLLGLPLSVYSTFVIEERFGFNRTTGSTFVADRLKGLAVAIVLGGPLLAAVLALFEYAGALAWVYAWMVAATCVLLGQMILPSVVLPLFNKFTPLTDGELRSAITDYAARVRFPVGDISVMDGSRRSTKGNAFFTGFGRVKRIALFDTLIDRHTVGEMVAVLAHEIGHYRRRHVLKGTLLGIAQLGLSFGLLALVLGNENLFEAFYADTPSVHLGLVIFAILLSPLTVVLSAAGNAISRRHELQADRFSAETTGSPQELASALRKLARDTLSQLSPHPFYVLLNYSHPPLIARVRALELGRL